MGFAHYSTAGKSGQQAGTVFLAAPYRSVVFTIRGVQIKREIARSATWRLRCAPYSSCSRSQNRESGTHYRLCKGKARSAYCQKGKMPLPHNAFRRAIRALRSRLPGRLQALPTAASSPPPMCPSSPDQTAAPLGRQDSARLCRSQTCRTASRRLPSPPSILCRRPVR